MNADITRVFAGIEAGGTKFNCVIGNAQGEILLRQRIATRDPAETLPAALEFFRSAVAPDAIAALGIASFGPVELNPDASDYGHILSTPKPGWSNCDLRGFFARALAVPVGFQTDVNGALLGEWAYGAAKLRQHCVYVTVGTGIGGGVLINGQILQGISHPEVGHMQILQHPSDTFAGSCPFHGNCLEGLASGPAIQARWGSKAENLPPEHPAWDLQAFYLAQLCVNLTHCYSPELIILGGGVIDQTHLLPKIRREFSRQINGYCSSRVLMDLDQYLQRPALGDDSGTRGALHLAIQTLGKL